MRSSSTDTGSSPENRASATRYGAVTARSSPTNCREIVDAAHGLAAELALIDGEAIVFRPDGLCDWALRTKVGGALACLVA